MLVKYLFVRCCWKLCGKCRRLYLDERKGKRQEEKEREGKKGRMEETGETERRENDRKKEGERGGGEKRSGRVRVRVYNIPIERESSGKMRHHS